MHVSCHYDHSIWEIRVNNDAAKDLRADDHADLATDGAGNLAAVWSRGSQFVGMARITTAELLAGARWTDPACVNNNWATDQPGSDEQRQVATDGIGNWVVLWLCATSYTP